MPCIKCKSDFNLFNWKLKCFECQDNYCSKCLRKVDGEAYCGVCEILVRRPPIRSKLMELKPKDLQQYLNRRNISTHGICEKQELVELFYKHNIPVKYKRNQRIFNNSLGGSVPNLSTRSQTYLSNIRTNAEAVFNTRNWTGQSANNSPQRPQSPPEHPPRPQAVVPPEPSAPPDETATTSTQQNQNEPVNAEIVVEPSPQQPRKYPKLTDFNTVGELHDLSSKQLKELLTLNRVDFKGCVEKAELLERADRLWNDANERHIEEFTGDGGEDSCKICMDAPLDCVLLECGHIATCINCGKRLAECPICRQYVTRVVRTFKV